MPPFITSFPGQNGAMVPIPYIILWHLRSETGVHQVDPLGPLFFALVLHKALAAIDMDDDCLHLILQVSYASIFGGCNVASEDIWYIVSMTHRRARYTCCENISHDFTKGQG